MKEKMKVWVPVHAAALARCGRRALALVLCLALCLSMLPLGALAEGTEDHTHAAAQSSGAAAPKTAEPKTIVPETTVPERTVPERTVPETTVPETTVPETTVPETTVPETTVPETTVPETTVPETTVPETTVPETTVPETTVPETTVPETTVPETTVPETTEPDPAVETLKALLEALPETVTEDNAEAVAAQLEAIDEAKSALTEAQLAQLDFARYDAVLAAWMALVDGAYAVEPLEAVAQNVSVTAGDSTTYYVDLDSAIQDVMEQNLKNPTIRLLANVNVQSWNRWTPEFTLDLNGKTLTTNDQVIFNDYWTRVTLTGAGKIVGKIQLRSGRLTIPAGCTAEIEEIWVDKGDFYPSDGQIKALIVNDYTGYNVALSGGSYSSIQVNSDDANVASLLKLGYRVADATLANLQGKAYSATVPFSVVKCTHAWNESSCQYCNERRDVTVTADGTTTYYSTLPEAIEAAQSGTMKNPTVKLLADMPMESCPWITGKFTLDLNGKEINASSYGVSPTISGGELTLIGGGNFSARCINLNSGKLVIPAGNSVSLCEVDVNGPNAKLEVSGGSNSYLWVLGFADGNVALSGGSFTTIEVDNSVNATVADLLAPGYRVQNANYEDICVKILKSVTIEKCTHTWEQGVCKFCNAHAVTTSPENSTVYLDGSMSVTLTAKVNFVSDDVAKNYQWYAVDADNRETLIPGATGISYTCAETQEGTYGFICAVTANGVTEKSQKATVTVSRRGIQDAVITLGEQKTYNGSAQDVNIASVTLNGTALAKDVDYEIVSGSSATDVQNTTLTIQGIGKYRDTATADWSLQKAEPTQYAKTAESRIYYGRTSTDNEIAVQLPAAPEGAQYGSVTVMGPFQASDNEPYMDHDFAITVSGVENGTLYYRATVSSKPVYAWLTVLVTSQNFNDYFITVCVRLVEQTPVVFSGIQDNQSLIYSGSAQKPAGTLTVSGGVDAAALTVAYKKVTQEGTTDLTGAPKDVGTYQVVYGVPQDASQLYCGEATYAFSITPKDITASGITGISRDYDGTVVLGLRFDNVTLDGVFDGDNVKVTGVTADDACYFENASAGENKKVYINPTKLRLEGDDAGNYRIAAEGSQTETTATIDRRDVTVQGLGAKNKTYDGTTDGTVVYSDVSFDGLIDGDNLTLEQNAVATFKDASAGTSKTVTITNLTLSGAAAGNYRLVNTEFTTEANIDKRTVTVSGIQAYDKDYDGATTATLRYDSVSFGNKIAGDDLTVVADGHFETADAGVDKNVVITNPCLGGTAKENYDLQISGTYTATATVRPRVVTIIGVTAKNRTYNGNTAAELELADGKHIGNLVGSDDADIDFTGYQAAFADKNVGTSKTVSIQGLSLTGDASGNYTLPQTFTLTADITKAAAPAAAPGSLTVANGYANSYTFDFSRLLPALSDGKEFGTVSYGSLVVDLGDYYEGGAAVDENGSLTLPIVQNDVTTVEDAGTVTVTVRSSNFEDITLTLNVRSGNRKLPLGAPTLSRDTLTYGEALSAITLSGSMYYVESDTARSGRVQVPGSFTWTTPSTKPNAGSCEAQWTFTPADPVSYLSVTGISAIRVLKAEQEAPGTPELESREQTRITLKAIAQGPDGAKVQYRMDDGPWQDSPVFEDLIAGEEYAFQVRYGETENYNASPESRTAKFTTKPYVLTFQVNGGSVIDSVEAKAGAVIRLNSYRPTRSGYRFEGWYSDESLKTKVTSVTMDGDTTVYARWTVRNSVIPATGDDAPIALSLTIFALSAVAFTGLVALGRKRKEQ